MRWHLADRYSTVAVALADRHYSRQTPGSPQFIPPGRPLVLVTADALAAWVSLYQRPEYTDHAWPGAWLCPFFRNESPALSSELVREAVAATIAGWGSVPSEGMITFVDDGAVRHKRDPGRCFLRAGFRYVLDDGGGRVRTERRGRLVLRLDPADMPEARAAIGSQGRLFAEVA